nr:YkgJ family cysteine cluster protein [uncultured Fluviicola sp.]
MQNTILHPKDSLSLTCSRSGTCCHGNCVRLNPWELMCLAQAKGMSSKEFRKKHTQSAGTVLQFNGRPNHTGKSSCGLYEDGKGCGVHPSRPLACRLFPLGRQIQNGTAQYMHEGTEFPCLKECPEVLDLPKLTVEDYLAGQETAAFEQAQDAYMEMMQNLADISFELLLDTSLSESGDTQTLASWRRLGVMDITALSNRIPAEWLDALMIPDLEEQPDEVLDFVQAHQEILDIKIQELSENLSNLDAIRESAILLMALALFLAHAIGADAKGLSEHWIEIAKSHGARE